MSGRVNPPERPETQDAPDGRPAPTPEQQEEAERALKTGGQESQ